MKAIFLLLCVAARASFGAGPLLTYTYGNQITRSELSIQLDGTVQRSEVRGPGEAAEVLPEIMLTADTRKQLFMAIHEISQAQPVVVPGHETLDGSSSGSLKAYSQIGPYVIRVIERGKPLEKDVVSYSPAPEARWIEKLVFSLVENDMYRIETGE
jgi:hypothetical protein